jgi:hypothetical protein
MMTVEDRLPSFRSFFWFLSLPARQGSLFFLRLAELYDKKAQTDREEKGSSFEGEGLDGASRILWMSGETFTCGPCMISINSALPTPLQRVAKYQYTLAAKPDL